MLKEISCSFFRQPKMSFHEGLNVVLGDDDAKNSIGKSSALMVVDFVFGGDSLLADESGAIFELGHHHYDFTFEFTGTQHYFSRATNLPQLVYLCDKNYARKDEKPIKEYREWLKDSLGLSASDDSFRSLVSPFARIWGKGELEPSAPFAGDTRERPAIAVSRLIDLFEQSDSVSAEQKILEEQIERRKLVSDSMKAELIPSVTKTQYKENEVIVFEGNTQIEKLKRGFSGGLSIYETLFDEKLKKLQAQKNDLGSQQLQLENKARRLQREISGITPRLSANIALVKEFFSTVNVEKLERVEAFHQQIGSIVKKELKEELASTVALVASIVSETSKLDVEIQRALQSKGVPDDLFQKVFELKAKTDKAESENKYYDQREQLTGKVSESKAKLEKIVEKIHLKIEKAINTKLEAFNRVVYGPLRNSSKLRITSPSSYSFSSTADTGTGKTYAGLVGLDIAMLSLTRLPLLIHDSIIYKNIEVPATERILRILSAAKRKQVFLSFDEAAKYSSSTKRLLTDRMVVRLSNSNLLYNKDWRTKV